MTQEELQISLKLHLKWLNDEEGGVRANLGGANLEGANLEGANLQGAKLEGANLEGANLEGANLVGANLVGANLQVANLESANLRYANLQGANLEGANLEGANLENTCVKSFTLGKHFGFYHEGYLKIGCEDHSIEHWLANYADIGSKANYSETEIELYGSIIKAVAKSDNKL